MKVALTPPVCKLRGAAERKSDVVPLPETRRAFLHLGHRRFRGRHRAYRYSGRDCSAVASYPRYRKLPRSDPPKCLRCISNASRLEPFHGSAHATALILRLASRADFGEHQSVREAVADFLRFLAGGDQRAGEHKLQIGMIGTDKGGVIPLGEPFFMSKRCVGKIAPGSNR